MKTIYKYRLPRDGHSIEINDYVLEFLNIMPQHGWPHIWAVVDTERKGQCTEIVAWGTGWDLPDEVYYDTDYLGSCGDYDGYIWHYFAATRSTDLWSGDYAYKYMPVNGTGTAKTYTDPYYANINVDGIVDSTIGTIDWDRLSTLSTKITDPCADATIANITDYINSRVKSLESSVADGKTEKTYVYA